MRNHRALRSWTLCFALACAPCMLASPAFAQQRPAIIIDDTSDERLNIAVQHFALVPGAGSPITLDELRGLGETMHTALLEALEFSGVFKALAEPAFLGPVHTPPDYGARTPECESWKQSGADALLQGSLRVREQESDTLFVNYQLYDVVRCKALLRDQHFRTPPWSVARLGRVLADRATLAFTGTPGVADTELAFVSERSGAREVWISNAGGTRQRRATGNNSIAAFPDWAPDGESLVYTSYHSGNRPLLFVMSRVERYVGRILQALPGDARLYRGVYAPGGGRLALVMSRGGASELYVSNEAGERFTRLTNSRSIEVSPSWSPDGKRLAYVSDRTGRPEIYIMNANGRDMRRLTYDGSYNTAPAWSPDGRWIAYETRVGGQFDIWLIDPEGRANRPLITHRRSDEHPSWSPDGRKLVFQSTRRGHSDLYVMDLASAQVRRITDTGENRNPDWGPYRSDKTPDGGWIR